MIQERYLRVMWHPPPGVRVSSPPFSPPQFLLFLLSFSKQLVPVVSGVQSAASCISLVLHRVPANTLRMGIKIKRSAGRDDHLRSMSALQLPFRVAIVEPLSFAALIGSFPRAILFRFCWTRAWQFFAKERLYGEIFQPDSLIYFFL